MFNTLVYIPTILAYTFITLLVVILGFIVIYVTHKIYTTLYDNLPVAQLSSKSLLSKHFETVTKSKDLLTLDIADGQVGRKSKTALHIIVTLAPCYLAYMMFESKVLQTPIQRTSRSYQIPFRRATSTSIDSQVSLNAGSKQFLIKYFDSLSLIPTCRDLQKCDNFKLNNMTTIIRRRK